MATYDRTAAKQSKKSKGKKKGQTQSQARKHKGPSPMVPYRKLANMLQSSGAQFVGEMAGKLKGDAAKGDNGAMVGQLESLASDGVGGIYGPRVQALAQEALESVK